MEMLESSAWRVRIGGVYVCGKIAANIKDNKALISQLKNKLRSIAKNDRSGKVKRLARMALGWIIGEEEIVDSYEHAMNIIGREIHGEIREKDLYSKYREVLKQF
ncbi:MAG: hypothetical protein N3A65_00330 [candidate division WOR-3 bacterium]|nr:hypothetical protein [candidate division WOR-3 bacterium]